MQRRKGHKNLVMCRKQLKGWGMRVLVYRYNSIYEPDIISVFKEFGVEVIEENEEMTNKSITSSRRVELVADQILKATEEKDPLLFVFSINFFPAISEVCEKLNTMYVCWSVDCPVLELFSNSLKNKCNRVFLFDKSQYERFYKYNPENIFYLPLSTNVGRMDSVISTITDEDKRKYSADVSFVGSLYSEKNDYLNLNVDEYTKGFVEGIVEAQLPIYGFNFIEGALNDAIVDSLLKNDEKAKLSINEENSLEPVRRFYASEMTIGKHISMVERIRTLNTLGKYFNVDLYTQSDTSVVAGVNPKGTVKTLTELPKVFNLSKINLNITMRPIKTGLPLRIFDIMGCGGFVMTNYQSEIPELFEIGVDLEAYASMEELVDKCAYYLEHEDERRQIALNGYEKVKKYHDIKNRVTEMFSYIVN